MGVVNYYEMPWGRESSAKVGVTEYYRTFRFELDDPTNDANTIYASGLLPPYQDPHPTNPQCTMREYTSVDPIDDTRVVWDAKLRYSNEIKSQEEEERENQPIPTLRSVEISWEGVAREVALYKDRNGDHIMNKAGDRFDPPLVTTVYDLVATIEKNLTEVPFWLFDYQGSVNDSPFTIDGLEAETGSALMGAVKISPKQRENGVLFRKTSIQLHFRAKRDGTDPPEAWKMEVRNDGLRERLTPGGALVNIYDNGTPRMPITTPWPLDVNGKALASGFGSGDITYVTSEIYTRRDFSALPLT